MKQYLCQFEQMASMEKIGSRKMKRVFRLVSQANRSANGISIKRPTSSLILGKK